MRGDEGAEAVTAAEQTDGRSGIGTPNVVVGRRAKEEAMMTGPMRRYTFMVIGLALLLRLGAVFALRQFHNPETWEYGPIARAAVAGEGLTSPGYPRNGIRMSPGYAVLLALAYAVFGEGPAAYITIECLQAIGGAITCFIVQLLALQLTGRTQVAAMAGLLCACYPVFVYAPVPIHPIVWDILLALLFIWLAHKVAQAPSLGNAVSCGIAGGVMVLFRGAHLPLVVLCSVWIWWHGRRLGAGRGSGALVALLVVGVMLAPWAVYQSSVLGRLTISGSFEGYQLWLGYHEGASGFAYAPERWENDERLLQSLPPQVRSDPVALDAIYRRSAVTFIKTRPLDAFQLAVIKAATFWLWDPHDPKQSHPLYRLPWLMLLVSSLPGFWLTRSRWPEWVPVYLLACVPWAESIAGVFISRFRMPFEACMLILGALTIWTVADRHDTTWRCASGLVRPSCTSNNLEP
jgi:hypothetical protein